MIRCAHNNEQKQHERVIGQASGYAGERWVQCVTEDFGPAALQAEYDLGGSPYGTADQAELPWCRGAESLAGQASEGRPDGLCRCLRPSLLHKVQHTQRGERLPDVKLVLQWITGARQD